MAQGSSTVFGESNGNMSLGNTVSDPLKQTTVARDDVDDNDNETSPLGGPSICSNNSVVRTPSPTGYGTPGQTTQPAVRKSAPLSEAWCRLLLNHKRPTAIFWLVLSVIAIFGAVRLVDATTVDVQAPSSTDSRKAQHSLGEAFPNYKESTSYVLYITRSTGPVNISSVELETYLTSLAGEMMRMNETQEARIQTVQHYYSLRAAGLLNLSKTYMKQPNWDATILTVSINSAVSNKESKNFYTFLKGRSSLPDYDIMLVGAPAFEAEAQEAAKNDLVKLAAIVFPITLLVMAFLLRSLRLIIIGAVCLGISSSIAFAIAWLLSFGLHVSTTTPPFLLALVIATSVSYSLIILCRYREALLERRRNGLSLDGNIATRKAVVHAGETVVVSGVTLAVCFLGLCIYPMSSIQSFGISCGLGVLLVVWTSLTLTPLMLLVWLPLWEGAVRDNTWWDKWDKMWSFMYSGCCKCKWETEDVGTANQIRYEEGAIEDCDSDWNVSHHHIDEHLRHEHQNLDEVPTDTLIDKKGIWYLLAVATTRFPWGLVLLITVVGAGIPIDLNSTKFDVTADSIALVPYDAEILVSYKYIGEFFTFGTVYPYYILMEVSDENDKITDPFRWEGTQNVLSYIINNVPNTRIEDFDTASLCEGKNTVLNDYLVCEYDPTQDVCVIFNHTKSYINSAGTAMLAKYTSKIAPMSEAGKKWLKAAREVTEPYLKVSIAGQPAEVIDSMDGVYGNFGLMIGITTFMVLLLVACSFKSALIPIRVICTRAVTLAFVYGLADMAYCNGDLSWLGSSFTSPTNEISYTNALVALPILVGVGLAPDFFLTTRIIECRRAARPEFTDGDNLTTHSVILGMTRTGHIISAAGIVMIACFAGLLLFSKVTVMHQIAFFLTVGLIFETFVIRPLVVPAATALLGEYNWWPCSLLNWNILIKQLRGSTDDHPPPTIKEG